MFDLNEMSEGEEFRCGCKFDQSRGPCDLGVLLARTVLAIFMRGSWACLVS